MEIYLITNKLTKVQYVGKTKKDVEERWKEHCKPSNGCRYLRNAIQHYGKDSFSVEIIDGANSLSELNYLERHYIHIFNTLAPNGYNLNSGGAEAPMLEQTKLKISIANTGKKRSEETKAKMRSTNKRANLGIPVSPEIRKKISEANKGKKRSLETRNNISKGKTGYKHRPESIVKMAAVKLGKKMSDVAKEKMRLSSLGQLHTEATKQKISQSKLILGSKNDVKILCVETGDIFPSIRQASIKMKVDPAGIANVLSGKWNQTKGFKYKKL